MIDGFIAAPFNSEVKQPKEVKPLQNLLHGTTQTENYSPNTNFAT